MTTKDSIIRASVAPVKVGGLVFEGLMDNEGSFLIAVPQICAIFSFPIKHASRDIKALLGKDYSFPKRRTPLNSKAVNTLTLPDFERLLRKLDKSGNSIAESICDDLIGLSLHQLFCDAFEIEFDGRDRQTWLKNRQKSKEAFWSLGDATKVYKDVHPERSQEYHAFIYCNCQKAVNKGLFGKSASEIRMELGVTDLLRDHYGEAALRRLDLVQSLASANIIHRDIEPLQAVKDALAMYNFEVMDYRE